MIPATLEEYQAAVERFRNETVPVADIENFNPDVMDNAAFWQESIKKFGLLPICGALRTGETNEGLANYYNALLATYMGAYNLLNGHFLPGKVANPIKLLDIGAGFGSLLHYIKNMKYDVRYHGIDINNYLNLDDITICDGKTIPKELGEDFDYVFSSNVFQHLSIAQRDSYYSEAWRVLKPRGTLTLSFTCNIPSIARNNGEDGNSYLYTAGQYTQLESANDVMLKISNLGFNILSTTVRYLDGCFTIHAQKPGD